MKKLLALLFVLFAGPCFAQTQLAPGQILGNATSAKALSSPTNVAAVLAQWGVPLPASVGGTGINSLGTGVATALGGALNASGGLVGFNGALGTPTSGVGTNLTGTAASLTAGHVTTNANLTGDVTSVGNATTLTNAPVIAKVLTGFTSGAGTVTAADSILTAIQKVYGNDALKLPLAGGTMSGNIGGNFSLTGNIVFGGTITAPSLSTPSSNIAGSLCATSGGGFLYQASGNCFTSGAATSVTPLTTTVGGGTNGNLLGVTTTSCGSGSPCLSQVPIGSNLTMAAGTLNANGVQARQSILSGSVDATGFSNFASAGTGLNVNLSATATPLTLAFAGGFSAAAGAVDYVGQEASDVASFWASLPANQYSFLSIDRNVSTGALTATQTLMRPQKGPVFYTPRQALLHLDGFLNDDWGNAWGAVGAGATLTAGCAKFGSEGLSLTGSSSYVQTTQISNVGMGNWTIDVWANLTSNVGANIFSVGNAWGALVSTNASGKLLLNLSSGGASWDISPGSATGATTVTAGTFHHFALVFNGSSYVLYLDGVAQLTVSSSQVVWPNGVIMGVGTQVGTGVGTAGCFDEFDFVPFARWVANFTPPTAAYSVAGDWFDTSNMQMKTAVSASTGPGSPPTFSVIQRQYVAEAQTGASAVSAVYDYSASSGYKGADFALNSSGKLKVGDYVFYAQGTPQFITGTQTSSTCTPVTACTIGSPVTWVLPPSMVPPDAKWFDVQMTIWHAAIAGTSPGNQDCTFQSIIPVGGSQGYVALGTAYSNYTGFGTITQTTAFTEGAGGVARFPVINGIAAFETLIVGTTCANGGVGNQALIKAAIVTGFNRP